MKMNEKRLGKITKLRTKIVAGFAIIVLFMILLSTFNTLSLNDMNTSMEDRLKIELNTLIYDESLLTDIHRRTSLMRGFMLYENESYRTQFNQETENIIALEKEYRELGYSPEIKKIIEKKIIWGEVIQQAFEAYDKGDSQQAKEIMNTQAEVLETEIAKGITDLVIEREILILDLTDDLIRRGTIIKNLGIIVTMVLAFLSIVIAYVISNNITKPIKRVMKQMKEISNGNLILEPLPVTTEDETGQLSESMNLMQTNLTNMIQKLA
ncbi:HAMP domain-containing protein, partial [Carnobacterium sp.]|uniref:HAMP domain-containing protein n=1 Tax=Carnobacterium sp. TaxID=48221 RepID=UPI003C7917FE